MTNRKAVKLLEQFQITNAPYIVRRLVEGGFIEEEVLSEPERIAQAAKDWLGKTSSKNPREVYGYASGWSTGSWAVVLGSNQESDAEDFFNHNPESYRNIFLATVLLAKEAGIDL